jgi:hypothetical protein
VLERESLASTPTKTFFLGTKCKRYLEGARGSPAVACVRHSLARSVESLKTRAVRYPLAVAPVPAAAKRAGAREE